MGNTGTDLDSVCCALALALMHAPGPKAAHAALAPVVPVVNCKREEWVGRVQQSWFLKTFFGMTVDDLVFWDDVVKIASKGGMGIPSPEGTGSAPTAHLPSEWLFILVDHNSVDTLQKPVLRGHVVGVIDHHDQEADIGALMVQPAGLKAVEEGFALVSGTKTPVIDVPEVGGTFPSNSSAIAKLVAPVGAEVPWGKKTEPGELAWATIMSPNKVSPVIGSCATLVAVHLWLAYEKWKAAPPKSRTLFGRTAAEIQQTVFGDDVSAGGEEVAAQRGPGLSTTRGIAQAGAAVDAFVGFMCVFLLGPQISDTSNFNPKNNGLKWSNADWYVFRKFVAPMAGLSEGVSGGTIDTHFSSSRGIVVDHMMILSLLSCWASCLYFVVTFLTCTDAAERLQLSSKFRHVFSPQMLPSLCS